MRSREIFPGRPFVVMGASAGGLLALEAANTLKVDVISAILFNPVLDMSKTGFKSRATPPDGDLSISPLHQDMTHRHLPPIIVFHGASDSVVPLKTSEIFVTRVRSSDQVWAELVVWPAGLHGFFSEEKNREEVESRIWTFLSSHANQLLARVSTI